jgi:hypothetical protein
VRAAHFRHVVEHHVDKVVEATQRADELALVLHDDPDARADALVDQFCARP